MDHSYISSKFNSSLSQVKFKYQSEVWFRRFYNFFISKSYDYYAIKSVIMYLKYHIF
jgi:hypothetical protein